MTVAFDKTSDISSTRRYSDICGFLAFLANVIYSIRVILPLEEQVGSLLKTTTDPKALDQLWSQDQFQQFRQQLRSAHIVGISVSLLLFACQQVSFAEQVKAQQQQQQQQQDNKLKSQ